MTNNNPLQEYLNIIVYEMTSEQTVYLILLHIMKPILSLNDNLDTTT